MQHMKYTTGRGHSKLTVLTLALALMLSVLVAVPAYAAEGGETSEPTLWESFASLFTGEPANDAAVADANDGIQLYAAGDKGTKAADNSTLDAWNDILVNEGQATTQNIGRIWTDKSVFTDGATYTEGPLAGTPINVEGDHDFLVGLSALSSTSNTTTTTTANTPLDIVLVLDDSGSMADSIYNPVYDLNPNDTDNLYTPSDGIASWFTDFAPVWYEDGAWHQKENYIPIIGVWTGDKEFIPKTSPDDPNGQQVYERMTRTEALKIAVNNFIDQTAAENATISAEANKHRISIVPFATGTKNVRELTVCEGNGVT